MPKRVQFQRIVFNNKTKPNFLKPKRKRGRPSFKELQLREMIELPEGQMFHQYVDSQCYEKLIESLKKMCPSDGKVQIRKWKHFVGIPNDYYLTIEKPQILQQICQYPDLVGGKDTYPEDLQNSHQLEHIGRYQYRIKQDTDQDTQSLKEVVQDMYHLQRDIFLAQLLAKVDVPYDILDGIEWPNVCVHDVDDMRRELRQIYARQIQHIHRPHRLDPHKITRKSAPVVIQGQQKKLVKKAWELVDQQLSYRQRMKDSITYYAIEDEIDRDQAEQYEKSIEQFEENAIKLQQSEDSSSHEASQSIENSQMKLQIETKQLQGVLQLTETLFMKALTSKKMTIIDFYYQFIHLERRKNIKLFRNYAYDEDLKDMGVKLGKMLTLYQKMLSTSREHLQMDKSLYQIMRNHFSFCRMVKDITMNPIDINRQQQCNRYIVLKEKVTKVIDFAAKSFHLIRKKYKNIFG